MSRRSIRRAVSIALALQGCTTEPTVSSDEALKIRTSWSEAVLDTYRKEYAELSDVWKGIDTKAQGTATIAGVFVAAAFTFAKDLAGNRLDDLGRWLLAVAILLLIVSIVCSVLALKMREVVGVLQGENIEKWTDGLEHAADADLPDIKRQFIDEQSKAWRKTVESSKSGVTRKKRWLSWAQALLGVAIALAAAVTFRILVG